MESHTLACSSALCCALTKAFKAAWASLLGCPAREAVRAAIPAAASSAHPLASSAARSMSPVAARPHNWPAPSLSRYSSQGIPPIMRHSRGYNIDLLDARSTLWHRAARFVCRRGSAAQRGPRRRALQTEASEAGGRRGDLQRSVAPGHVFRGVRGRRRQPPRPKERRRGVVCRGVLVGFPDEGGVAGGERRCQRGGPLHMVAAVLVGGRQELLQRCHVLLQWGKVKKLNNLTAYMGRSRPQLT